MRIVILSFGSGGMLHYALNTCMILAKNNIDVLLLTTDITDIIPRGISYKVFSIKNIKNMISVISDFNPDIIHITALHWYLPIIVFMLRKYRLVYTMHECNRLLGTIKNKIVLSRIFYSFILKYISEIITLCSFMAGQVILKYHRKVKIVYTTYYKELYENMENKKCLNLFDTEYINVLFFGLAKYKGADLILNSLLHMKETGQFNKIRFVIVGKCPDLNTLEKIEKLVNLENNYDISKNVMICNSYMADNTMDYLFRESDIIALPYIETSFSGILAYGINYGKKIIGPYLGSFVELKNIYPSNIYLIYKLNKINFLEKIIEISKDSQKINIADNIAPDFQVRDNYIDIYKSVLNIH
jgi:glycosyltransferase involved in cell wall biosynthesis